MTRLKVATTKQTYFYIETKSINMSNQDTLPLTPKKAAEAKVKKRPQGGSSGIKTTTFSIEEVARRKRLKILWWNQFIGSFVPAQDYEAFGIIHPNPKPVDPRRYKYRPRTGNPRKPKPSALKCTKIS